MTNLDGKQQITGTVGGAVTPIGSQATVATGKRGEIATISWKQFLAARGKIYRVSVGTITAGGDVSAVTGGGAGTTVDQDQPEIAIGVDTGYYLVPLAINVGAQVDLDADGEEGNIIATVDRSAGVPTSVTGTIETPTNQLDGGPAFPGRAFSAITADITDPTVDEILAYENIQASEFISNGTATNLTNGLTAKLRMDYVPDIPNFIAGPCGLYVYWGGTAAVTGIGSVVVAALTEDDFALFNL